MTPPHEIEFPLPIPQFVHGLIALLRQAGKSDVAELVEGARVVVSVHDSDNLNGGTYGWSLVFHIDLQEFGGMSEAVRLMFNRSVLEQANRLLGQFDNHGLSRVLFAPDLNVPTKTTSPYDEKAGFTSRDAFYRARELQFVRDLGTGGFAEVSLVKSRHLGNLLAAKFFRPHPFNADTDERLTKARERLLREGKLLASLRHLNVVRLFDCSLINSDPVLLIEYVDGISLDELVKKQGAVTDLNRAIDIVEQLLSALAECHRQGILHRDVSPKNVILENSGRVVLVDFGLGVSDEILSGSRLTTQPFGTPGFRAPELDHDPLQAKPTADVFGAAAVGVYLMTGRPPRLTTPPVIPGAASSLITTLQKALEVDPEVRFQSADDFRLALVGRSAPAQDATASEPARSILADETLYDLLSVKFSSEHEENIVQLVQQFGLAISRISALPARREPALATLLTAARGQIDTYWRVRPPSNRCDAKELQSALGSLIAEISGELKIPSQTTLKIAFTQPVKDGWLTGDTYDSWTPGMASGSGIRDCFYTTKLGRKWLRAQFGFDPPAVDSSSIG